MYKYKYSISFPLLTLSTTEELKAWWWSRDHENVILLLSIHSALKGFHALLERKSKMVLIATPCFHCRTWTCILFILLHTYSHCSIWNQGPAVLLERDM